MKYTISTLTLERYRFAESPILSWKDNDVPHGYDGVEVFDSLNEAEQRLVEYSLEKVTQLRDEIEYWQNLPSLL